MHHLPDGLYAAALTPFLPQTVAVPAIDYPAIPVIVEHLIADGITGIYVCGSTGEGVSLSTNERRRVLEEYVVSAAGRLKILVQVGHNSLSESIQLTHHAADLGVDAISATCPSYFKIESPEALLQCMKPIAEAAPRQPFFYYHIPALTGSQVAITEFARLASDELQNFAGLKYTTSEIHQFMELQALPRHVDADQNAPQGLQVFWGTDEMLLPAFTAGARAAIGSTYNVAAPLYLSILDDLKEGNAAAAQEKQRIAIRLVRVLQSHSFLPALKAMLSCRIKQSYPEIELFSHCRLPLSSPPIDVESLRQELVALGCL